MGLGEMFLVDWKLKRFPNCTTKHHQLYNLYVGRVRESLIHYFLIWLILPSLNMCIMETSRKRCIALLYFSFFPVGSFQSDSVVNSVFSLTFQSCLFDSYLICMLMQVLNIILQDKLRAFHSLFRSRYEIKIFSVKSMSKFTLV